MQEKLDALVRTQAMQLFRQQGLHFTINFSIFLLNFERRIASETLASSRKFKVQIQGTPLDFRGY